MVSHEPELPLSFINEKVPGVWDFPGGPADKHLPCSVEGTHVQSLVGELRSTCHGVTRAPRATTRESGVPQQKTPGVP